MKFIVSIFFVLIHLITSAQNNIQKSIIGKWKVIKIISLDNTIDFENNEQISKLNVPFVYINMLLEKAKFHFNKDILILEKYFENEEEKQIVELVKSEN